MNRFLLAALTFAVAGTTVSAQQSLNLDPLQAPQPTAESAPYLIPSSSAVEQSYAWFSTIGYQRIGPNSQGNQADSNTLDVPIPLQFTSQAGAPTGQLRGVGQIFAPKYLHAMYSGAVYNETSQLIPSFNQNDSTDQVYIDQFRNAGAFTISALRYAMYKNPTSQNPPPTQAPGLFVVYRTTTNFLTEPYRSRGFAESTDKLVDNLVYEDEVTPEEIDATLDPVAQTFTRTIVTFDPPLEFADGESAILLYQNTEAPAGSGATDEVQRVRVAHEVAPGGGNVLSRLVASYRALGVTLFRDPSGIDSILSAQRALSVGGVPARINMEMLIVGTIDIGEAGVRYHFGTEVGGQGVNAVSPNPVSADTRIPFTLTERAHVTLDLFATGGEHVRKLVDDSYIPGNYSAPLTVGDLENGVYLVRMTAGSKVYTQKIIVNK